MARGWLAIVIAAAMGGSNAWAGGIGCALAEMSDQGEVDAYAAELRSKGPKAFEWALDYYDSCVATAAEWQAKVDRDFENKAAGKSLDEANAAVDRARAVVDVVASQRDATVSRLYWYTDLDAAKAAAAESGKPILSLRMLGKLTDEYSCANSRYFRTALYSNKEVSDYLREHYVLHWQSVRPVPRVTIDFGDGRKLERTVTGNSAHYVLDAEGRPVDALPGLYGPKAFAEWLVRAEQLVAECTASADQAARDDLLVQYHAKRRDAVNEAFHMDMAAVAPLLLPPSSALVEQAPHAVDGKEAVEAPAFDSGCQTEELGAVNSLPEQIPVSAANERAESKGRVETPIVDSFLPNAEQLATADPDLWQRIAALHAEDTRLDEASIAVMRRENPVAELAGARAFSKARVEDPILRVVRSFETAMAIDAVRNEYLLHRQIHEWFCRRELPADVDQFNERVYAELFLTPSSDPWLGLAPANAYTALTDGGLTASAP